MRSTSPRRRPGNLADIRRMTSRLAGNLAHFYDSHKREPLGRQKKSRIALGLASAFSTCALSTNVVRPADLTSARTTLGQSGEPHPLVAAARRVGGD
jgi:hypothetical protein